MNTLPRLMLVTDRRRTRGRDLLELVCQAVDGGVGLVQVREKDQRDDELRELVVRLRERLPRCTELLVNSNLRVARTLRSGVHLPASAPGASSSERGGRLYGRSVHDETELLAAMAERVDYMVAGPVFRTESKPGVRPAGLRLIERVCRQAHPMPVFAIGGIGVARVPAVIHAGAHGVAVCGAILSVANPRRVAQALTLALDVSVRARSGARPAALEAGEPNA